MNKKKGYKSLRGSEKELKRETFERLRIRLS